jgi:hypothetical protein
LAELGLISVIKEPQATAKKTQLNKTNRRTGSTKLTAHNHKRTIRNSPRVNADPHSVHNPFQIDLLPNRPWDKNCQTSRTNAIVQTLRASFFDQKLMKYTLI